MKKIILSLIFLMLAKICFADMKTQINNSYIDSDKSEKYIENWKNELKNKYLKELLIKEYKFEKFKVLLSSIEDVAQRINILIIDDKGGIKYTKEIDEVFAYEKRYLNRVIPLNNELLITYQDRLTGGTGQSAHIFYIEVYTDKSVTLFMIPGDCSLGGIGLPEYLTQKIDTKFDTVTKTITINYNFKQWNNTVDYKSFEDLERSKPDKIVNKKLILKILKDEKIIIDKSSSTHDGLLSTEFKDLYENFLKKNNKIVNYQNTDK